MPNRNCILALKSDGEVEYTSANGTQFSSDIELDDLTEKLLDRFQYWIGQLPSPFDRADLEVLGQILYNVLFPFDKQSRKPSQVRDQFEKDLQMFWAEKNEGDRFRLTLELHPGVNKLHRYPWEFLFLPPIKNVSSTGIFLAGEKAQLILTRFIPEMVTEIDVRSDAPLRILVVFSSPSELPRITIDVIGDVIEEIRKLENLDHIEVRVESDHPTYQGLYELMNGKDVPGDDAKQPKDRSRFRPDIVHFIGHGEPGKLALMRSKEEIQADEDLEDRGEETREAAWCDSVQVCALFANHTPRLVFLHACDGAKPTSVDGFRDLARDLVYAQIPIVVAMQYSIYNKDATTFARKFYEEIRNGSLIDEAVRAGREALGSPMGLGKKSWGDRRFGTPVVYMRKNSAEVLTRYAREDNIKINNTVMGNYDPERIVRCPNPLCSGQVQLGVIWCAACGHDVGLCPNCQERQKQYRLMDKTSGKCAWCGYNLVEVTPRANAVASSSEQAEQELTVRDNSYEQSAKR